jgi:hypothetical protein
MLDESQNENCAMFIPCTSQNINLNFIPSRWLNKFYREAIIMSEFNKNAICQYDAKRLCENARVSCKAVEKIIYEIKPEIENIISKLDVEDKEINKDGVSFDAEIFSCAEEISDRLYGCIRWGAMELYSIALNAPTDDEYPNLPLWDTKLASEDDHGIAPANRVYALVRPDAIYIRTPILWNRTSKKNRWVYSRNNGSMQFDFFREEIRRNLECNDDFSSLDKLSFSKKLVHFMYAYPESSGNERWIPDNDSHEIKFILDAITRLLPGGDHPMMCSIYSSAIRTNLIPEGTYITVTPYGNGMKSEDEIKAVWTDFFRA